MKSRNHPTWEITTADGSQHGVRAWLDKLKELAKSAPLCPVPNSLLPVAFARVRVVREDLGDVDDREAQKILSESIILAGIDQIDALRQERARIKHRLDELTDRYLLLCNQSPVRQVKDSKAETWDQIDEIALVLAEIDVIIAALK